VEVCVDETLKWTICLTPLESASGFTGTKLLDIPPYTLVRLTGNHQAVGDPVSPWSEVEYLSENGQSHIGWVYEGYLEDYLPNFGDVVQIDPSIKTGSLYGPVQDINFNGITQHNLSACFCAAYVNGDSILDLLKKCQSNPALAFIIQGKTVNILQLQQLLTSAYGYSASEIKSLTDGLDDPVMGVQITSGRVSRMLQAYCLVVSVHISSFGEIVFYDPAKIRTSNMISHWVVVTDVTPFGFDDGEVTLYNPYPNNIEKIAFRLLYQSLGPNPAGLWIPGSKKKPASSVSNL
jgi:hypothetical protein